MLVLIQRVTQAKVTVEEETVGEIGHGILAFVGIEPEDGERELERMAERVTGYRIFGDEQGRMNRSVRDIGGDVLLVSQFTLAADTSGGMRASFTGACEPERARALFDGFVNKVRAKHAGRVETGRFGAHMVVSLVNDGPVTFLLRP